MVGWMDGKVKLRGQRLTCGSSSHLSLGASLVPVSSSVPYHFHICPQRTARLLRAAGS